MAQLTIKSDYLDALLWKIRAVKGTESQAVADPGSNPTDDEAGVALEARAEHLTREEVIKEIEGLDARQQAELVALAWIGRGGREPEEWAETVSMAAQEVEPPVADYLLGQPLIAELIAEGRARLD